MKTSISTAEDFEQRIAQHPFMEGLASGHVRVLADCGMETNFQAGQWIFKEGESANRFYILNSGRLNLCTKTASGDTVCLQTLGAGEVLGWSWLYPPYLWHFSAQAIEPTQAIFFYGTWLREHCERDHDFGYEILKRTSQVVLQRLQAARKEMLRAAAQASAPDRPNADAFTKR